MPKRSEHLDVVVTFLEMPTAPSRPPTRPPILPYPLTLMRLQEPTVSFYRYLYDTVGEPWLWFERRQMDPDALLNTIRAKEVEIYVLYCGGVPAGFAEIDWREEMMPEKGDKLLAYFGLAPDFIGRKLGRYFLEAIIDIAWSVNAPRRLIVRTCTLDHPAALPLYQKCGFQPTAQRTVSVPDPRKTGVLPPDAGPPLRR